MDSEILDDFSDDKVVQIKFVWKPRVVLAILWALVIWRFADGNYFSFKYIWGVVGLTVATYYVVINSSFSVFATLVLLMLGFFNVINHMPFGNYLVVGELIIIYHYFWLILVHIVLNLKKIVGSTANFFIRKSTN